MMNEFNKFNYAEAKQFLVDSGARVVFCFTSPTETAVTLEIDGEEWLEYECLLEEPEWNYSLRKVE